MWNMIRCHPLRKGSDADKQITLIQGATIVLGHDVHLKAIRRPDFKINNWRKEVTQENSTPQLTERRINAIERLLTRGPTTITHILNSNTGLFGSREKMHNTLVVMEKRNMVTKDAEPGRESIYTLVKAAFNWRPQHPMANPPQMVL